MYTPQHCSACGAAFEARAVECANCRTLKPLGIGHGVAPEIFQWAQDGQAMAKLRSIKPLVAFAQSVSQRAGRPWIEANFNGIRLSARQMPQVHSAAVQAAQMLGLSRMPMIYVSGARPWDALTFGTDRDAFIVMGSALVSCFQRSELMFLFAREMGHILAGHALWKTVIQFLVGEQSAGSGMMRNGVAGLLDPSRLIESAIELPLIAWARQAEVTADRAGLLVSSGLVEARKVLMIWSLKSPILYRQINIDAWLQQQESDSLDANIRLAESVTSATTYLTRRLKLMQEYDASLLVRQFRQQVMSTIRLNTPPRVGSSPVPAAPTSTQQGPVATADRRPSPQSPSAKKKPHSFACPSCRRPFWLPQSALAPSSVSKLSDGIIVRCPHEDCRKATRLRAKATMQPTDQIKTDLTVE
ncbi:MAG: M48 family metallopeptidase [Pirellulaceae bacterium]|jgi:Zn-dependent protease with chaperone function